jgi:hypothetical protein
VTSPRHSTERTLTITTPKRRKTPSRPAPVPPVRHSSRSARTPKYLGEKRNARQLPAKRQTPVTPIHPAAAAALRAVGDTSFTVAAILDRDGTVAVLLEDTQGRALTAVIEQLHGEWVTPEVLVGGRKLPASRRWAVTGEGRPLLLSSRKPTCTASGRFWYSVTGLAARDAATVTLESSLDHLTVPVGADGAVFALLRVLEDEKPGGVVQTHDGRAIPISAV